MTGEHNVLQVGMMFKTTHITAFTYEIVGIDGDIIYVKDSFTKSAVPCARSSIERRIRNREYVRVD